MNPTIFIPRCYGYVVTKQKVTEWEITKTKVGKEMEIFIELNKFITRQLHEDATHW